MSIDTEETLVRELREVADNLRIPPLRLDVEPRRAPRIWQPLLVAAAVVLILAGAVGIVASFRGAGEPEPAPSPSESSVASPTTAPVVVEIPTTAPTVPYLLNERLAGLRGRLNGAEAAAVWCEFADRDGTPGGDFIAEWRAFV